jgi:hypothetical protein
MGRTSVVTASMDHAALHEDSVLHVKRVTYWRLWRLLGSGN